MRVLPAARLPLPLERHAAARLRDGSVLVVGGCRLETALPHALRYLPELDRWEPLPDLPRARLSHTVVALPDGGALVFGGHDEGGLVAEPTRLTPEGTWVLGKPIEDERAHHRCHALPGGRVVVTGGRSERGFMQFVDVYDPRADKWSEGPDMGDERFDHEAVLVAKDRLVVVGGRNGDGALATADLVDLGANRTTALPRLPGTRRDHALAVLVDGTVVCSGGWDDVPNEPVATTLLWSSGEDRWTPGGPHARARFGHRLVATRTHLVAIGGNVEDGATSMVECWDPETRTWSVTEPLLHGRIEHTATRLSDGSVLVVGGFSTDRGEELASCERLVP